MKEVPLIFAETARMRRISFTFLFIAIVCSSLSQELAQVNLAGGAELRFFSLLTDGNLQIRISPEGRILEWGTEERSIRSGNYYAPSLQPYPGRVDYYGPEADSVSRGKVRSIGSAVITYYQAFETKDKVGKIRTAGRLLFDYYSQYDNPLLLGKIRMIGNLQLEYYTGFDDPACQGKLKSVGSTPISYYSSFDDKAIRGKCKSIGSYTYSWYSSLDRTGFAGGLKAGPYRQAIAGIVYIVQ